MLNFVSSILCCCFNCRLTGFEIHIRSWAARVSCYAELYPKGRRQALNSFKKPSTNQQWKYLMRSVLFHGIKQNTCLALISIDFHLWTRLASWCLFVSLLFFCPLSTFHQCENNWRHFLLNKYQLNNSSLLGLNYFSAVLKLYWNWFNFISNLVFINKLFILKYIYFFIYMYYIYYII